ncbi:MAG: hypothetical protein Q8R92_15660 [Deltaproteobacteria bacterium]|nr:hypothetical protein [Deltaproteobacteria bacterium]
MAKVKGTALVPAVKLVRKNRKKLEPLLDDATRAFVSQRILPGAWYPMEDATRLLLVVCRFFGGSPAQAMELVGRFCAEDDLRGVYENVIQADDLARTFRRAVMLCRNYVDTATLSVAHMDAALKQYVMRLDGMPKSDVPYCACVLGMAKVVARFVGVEDTYKIEETRCTLRGDPFCEFHSRWG